MKGTVVAVVAVVAILIGAGVGYLAGGANERTVTSVLTTTSVSTIASVATVTSISTSTLLSTSTLTEPLTQQCGGPAKYAQQSQNLYWFLGTVNYSGGWVATALVYNGSSTTPAFAGCYVGVGFGWISFEYPVLSNTSTILATAQKVGNDSTQLRLTVNGEMNTTSVPYGSARVTALVNYPLDRNPPLDYLTDDGSYFPGHGYVPLWGEFDGHLFNCVASASTVQGCTQRVTSSIPPHSTYVINIRYPFANSTEPQWANCLWTIPAAAFGGYGKCIPISSTWLVVAEPASPGAPPHS